MTAVELFLDPKLGYKNRYFDIIMIGRSFEQLDVQNGGIALIHEMLRLIHDPALSGLAYERKPSK